MNAGSKAHKTIQMLILTMVISAVLLPVPVADAQGRNKKIDCFHCRDAMLLTCEEHMGAKEWCEEVSFYCSECRKTCPCCRGRGMTPCKCVDHSWDKLGKDPGFKHLDDRIKSQQKLVETMGADPMYVVTEHFLLMSTMEGVKFSPGEISDMSVDLDVMKKSFPWIFRNLQQLSPHAMLHLYAHRLERIYKEYCEALGMTVAQDRMQTYRGKETEVFLAGPVEQKDKWASLQRGATLVTGGGGKFVLAQKDAGTGGRNRRFYGPNLSGDVNFFDGVIHLTGRCLIERFFRVNGKNTPGWLKIGFPHYLEWKMLNQCSYYTVSIEIKGLGQDWVSQGWNNRINALARKPKESSFASLSRKDFSDLGFNEHVLAWGYVDYLINNQPKDKFLNYLKCLRKRESPRDALMEAYGWSELTLENKWRRHVIGGANEDEGLTREERFVAEFDRSRTHPDLETRASAAYYLKFCNNIDAAMRILQAFQEKDILVRASALEALKAFTNEDAVRYVIEKGLSHPSNLVKRNTAIALGSFEDVMEISVPLMMKLLKDGSERVRAGAVHGLGLLYPEEAYLSLVELVDDKSPEVRVEVALALWNYKRDDALTKVLTLLRDPVWAVRLASIRALSHIRDPRIIPALIDQLGKEGGRLREDIHDLLVKITHQDFQINAEKWKWWWDNYGEKFSFRKARAKARNKTKYAMQYHDVETCSKKFIFLLDVSSSMTEMVDVKRVPGRTYTGKDLRKQKVDVAKTEIARLLRTFDKNIYFNIITFADEVENWKKKVTSSTKGSVKNAERYIWDIKIPDKSATNIYDALMKAFDMVDAGFKKRKFESVVDTMFLLSDGRPTAGSVTDVDMILRTVKERNRIHGIKIHTFALGGGADAYFLKSLSAMTRGQYQVIRIK